VSDDPPALNAAGVHVARVDWSFPPDFEIGGDVSFAHATLDFSAEAGKASGAVRSVPAVTARTSTRVRTETFIVFTPCIRAMVYDPSVVPRHGRCSGNGVTWSNGVTLQRCVEQIEEKVGSND